MRALVLEGNFGIENLTLKERDVPKAGPGQVVLKMKAGSLNYRDLATVTFGGNPKLLPLVPLSDGGGGVVEVGEGGTRLAKGDRVGTSFVQGCIWGGAGRRRLGPTGA